MKSGSVVGDALASRKKQATAAGKVTAPVAARGAPTSATPALGGQAPASGAAARPAADLKTLREQAGLLAEQLHAMEERIRELERPEEPEGPKAMVQADRCTGCGECVEVCPNKAVAIRDGVAVIDKEECTGCGVCVDECPKEAMTLA